MGTNAAVVLVSLALGFSFAAMVAIIVMAYRLSRDAMLAGYAAAPPRVDEEVRVLMSDVDSAEALNAKELHTLMVTAVDDVLSDTEMNDSERADLLATLTDIAEAYGRGLVLREKNKPY
jgi:hypothetical protein